MNWSEAGMEKAKGIWAEARKVLGESGLLSVIMPAYGLEAVIAKNIQTVAALLDGNIPFEILPVDDGSHDKTAAQIRLAAERDPEHVRPVFVKVNSGKGNALKRGFESSTGSHILLLDGDLDLSPDRISTFFRIMDEKRAAIVIGSKRHPDSKIDYPWHRRLASAVYYTLVRMLVGLPVSDTQVGMKLFTREALKWSFDRMLVKHFAFDLEVLSIANAKGFSVAEAPIEMHFGKKVGCLSWKNVKQTMNDTLAIFYRLRLLRYYDSVEVAPAADNPPLVSVVIACPAPSEYLTEALTALGTQTYRNFEVIVLPDAPFDTPATAYPLQIIATGKVRPAEKRNLGIQKSHGEIVAFLDDDAYPVPNWLESAVKYFTLDDVGGVGGPGITPPGDPFMAQAGGRVYENRFVSGNYRYRYAADRVRRSVDDFPSCNLFVRKTLLDDIGGYRTDFWPGEDTILCLNIVRDRKKRIVYDPWAQVYHHRRPLFGAHLRQVGRYALHRGHFAKRFPATSFRFSYMVPTFFVLGNLVGIAICGISRCFPENQPLQWLKLAYLAVLVLYLLVTLLSTCSPLHPLLWLTSWLGVMATHLAYGVRFAQGMLSRKMPCEVAKFDHPAENGSSHGKA
ncbi:MAG: glycosyltransferase [Kiritimatiellae bacterium]|nr:glycosyltransferase [Kiritimatiellia bacterium]